MTSILSVSPYGRPSSRRLKRSFVQGMSWKRTRPYAWRWVNVGNGCKSSRQSGRISTPKVCSIWSTPCAMGSKQAGFAMLQVKAQSSPAVNMSLDVNFMCGHEAAADDRVESDDSDGRTGDEEMDEEGGESEDDSEASDPTIDEEDLPEANIRERPKRQTRGQRTESSESEDSDFSRATEQEEEPDEEKTARPPLKSLRQSTVEQRRGSREQELVAQAKAPSRKPLKPKSSLTQEARLQEAVRTEEKSREEFKALQSQEDQRREARRRSRRRSVFEGARIRFVSKQVPVDQTPDLIGGRPGVENCVEFINCDFSDVCGKDPRSLAIQEAEHPSSQASQSVRGEKLRSRKSDEHKPSAMTLWPFQDVECHSLPYTRLFVAPRCSVAYCLWVLCSLLLVAIPLFATFVTDNVWVKDLFYRVQPVVSFTNELFLIASGDTAESAVGWSSLDSTGAAIVALIVNHALQEMPSTGFRSLLLLAVYNVQLRGKVSEELTGLVALDLTSPYAASGVSIYGQLVFRQKLPLFQSFEQRRLYASSPLEVNWRSNWIPENQPLTLEALLGRYAQRPEVKVCVASAIG
eukprot:g22165.t1